MAEENNHKMDEMLRKYARQRREGAEFPVHPATRKMLHDEVKRVYRPTAADGEPRPRGSWIAMFWPHLAAAMAVALVLAFSLSLFAPPQKTKSTAANDKALTDREMESPVPPQAPARPDLQPARESLADENAGAKIEQEEKRLPALKPIYDSSATASAPPQPVLLQEARDEQMKLKVERSEADLSRAAAPAPKLGVPVEQVRQGAESLDVVTTSEADLAYTPVPAAPAGTQPANAGLVGGGITSTALPKAFEETVSLEQTPTPFAAAGPGLNNIQNLGAALRREFMVLTNATPQATSLWASNFQMEQLGQQIRFTDAAGSAYLGELQPAPTDYFARDRRVRALGSTTATNNPTPAGNQAWFFKATGLNRTLGKNLVFEGQFFDPTNKFDTVPAPTSSRTRAAAPSGSAGRAARANVPTIVGRVLVDGTNAVPVRAISQEP